MFINKVKKEIVNIAKALYSKGFIAGTDGNISYKISDNSFLITPSGVNKGFLKEKDLIVIDKNGKSKKGKVSTEWRMHLKVYEKRSDIKCVIHAHPPCTVAMSISEKGIPVILPEIILTMGCSIPVSNYVAPTSPKNADEVEKYISNYDFIILKRHGVVSACSDLISAYNKIEKIENLCLVNLYTKILGDCSLLNKEEINELENLKKLL